jgi:hypothetical protein
MSNKHPTHHKERWRSDKALDSDDCSEIIQEVRSNIVYAMKNTLGVASLSK